MAISDQIQKFTSKARDVAGAATVLADLPGIPAELRSSINSLFGTGTGLAPAQNRRDLNNFLSTAGKLGGFSRPSYFYVEIPPPPFMRDSADEARTLAFLCESTNLPGVNLATSDIRRYGIGPIEKKPYAPIFTDVTFTFFADASGMVQKFFYKWMNGIVKFDEVHYGPAGEIGFGETIEPFEVNYKNRYATDILITTVDESNNDIINVRLRDAFPIFFGDISLGWNDTDSISRLPINFTYYNWKIENININQLQETRSQSIIQRLIKAGTAIQTLSTLRKPNNVADIINVVNNTKIAIGGLL